MIFLYLYIVAALVTFGSLLYLNREDLNGFFEPDVEAGFIAYYMFLSIIWPGTVTFFLVIAGISGFMHWLMGDKV